jgi:hypothetical protein
MKAALFFYTDRAPCYYSYHSNFSIHASSGGTAQELPNTAALYKNAEALSK